MTLTYEEQRRQNIADNDALLKSLGLDVPVALQAKPKPKPMTKAQARKRKIEAAAYVDKGSSPGSDESGTPFRPRRSMRERSTMRSVTTAVPKPLGSVLGPRRRAASPESPESDSDQLLRKSQRLGVRTQEPLGTFLASRMDCSTDAAHAPTVAGISGNAELGAWSVALSGGYPDDMDLGDVFTYTGSGGRDLKGTRDKPKNLRTAPQTFDQSFEHSYNAALKTSAETKKPVRVMRGFKLLSPYASAEGYRYDGLYIVERAWMAPGLTKTLRVCKYAFKRLPGQPPLPRNDEETAGDVETARDADEAEEDELDGQAADDVTGDEEAVEEDLDEAEDVITAPGSNDADEAAPQWATDPSEGPRTRRSTRSSAVSATPADVNGATNGKRRSGCLTTDALIKSGSGDTGQVPAVNGKRSGRSAAAEPSKRLKTRSSLAADTTLRRSRRNLVVTVKA
ncbi:hypothetical protein CspeluHIS016_0111740 [Cutaneotrichosporon spelunceum]|uniref:YDG domain-containing protein n=1 Tax=Cutaneotrichosporon spelunceum TaxID=1672016 RepID=A0AAD3TQ16_9TREE|nr:hypothetical protein CspeluHIS016_0111740 [Cutaneotrichosporon spelunceum]